MATPTSILLILIDGMRPDGLMAARAPVMQQLVRGGASTLAARTIMPSSTLPCHSSLFYGVSPQRHGITNNTWHPIARPVPSLFDVVWRAGRRTAMFYNWAELRDMAAPSSLDESYMIAYERTEGDSSDQRTFDHAATWLRSNAGFGLAFAYFGMVDIAGHRHGWMSEAYLKQIEDADRAVGRVIDALPPNTTVVLTADHGGHDKTHGTDRPEDMTIPLAFHGHRATAGHAIGDASIMDIAPTVAHLLGIDAPRDWEGKVLDLGHGVPVPETQP
jgi:predicted AlkP superfamily pyrophosphatase or phosphodiesterase